jgi:hypothetical protein
MRITPPVEPLIEVVERLEGLGVVSALGGSGLLAALGLADRVRDWDLTTDAPLQQVLAAVHGLPHESVGSDHLHADSKLMLSDRAVEIISRFAFHAPKGVVRIPTVVTGRWQDLPLGSPEAWAVAYDLLDRPAKRDLLLTHVRERGHDPGIVRRLLAEPLPEGISRALASL